MPETEATGPLDSNKGARGQADEDFSPPDYGRTVRVVGPFVNVDMEESPHPKNRRGELGKALFNLQHNTISKDPLTRVSSNHGADRRHYLQNVVNQTSKGKVNPNRVRVADPEAMTRHIKAVAHYMGGDIVTIARAHPTMMYAGTRYVQDGTAEDAYQKNTPQELVRKFPYIIAVTTAWDYDKLQAHRHPSQASMPARFRAAPRRMRRRASREKWPAISATTPRSKKTRTDSSSETSNGAQIGLLENPMAGGSVP